MIELRRIEDRIDPGCVTRSDPDGAYLFVAKLPENKGWVSVTVIGQLALLDDYVSAAAALMGKKFEVEKVYPLEHFGDPQTQFDAVKRGFTAIIMKPAAQHLTQKYRRNRSHEAVEAADIRRV